MLVLEARTGSWRERWSVLLRTGMDISLPLILSASSRVTRARAGQTASGEGSQAGISSQDMTLACSTGCRALCVERHGQKLSKHDHKNDKWDWSRSPQRRSPRNTGVMPGGGRIQPMALHYSHNISWGFSAGSSFAACSLRCPIPVPRACSPIHHLPLAPWDQLRPISNPPFPQPKTWKKTFRNGTILSLMFINHQSHSCCWYQSRTQTAVEGDWAASLQTRLPHLDHFGLSLHVWKDLKVHKINSR